MEKEFAPSFTILSGKKAIVSEIQAAAKKATRVLLAADPDRLSQVLINLVQNAAQASQPGQEIILSLEPEPQGRVALVVSDQGSGVQPQHMSQIFNPFFTTKQRGTGLGLPLARRIVEEHGGRLELESQPDQGTQVRVSLPVLGQGPGRPAAGAGG